MSGNGDTNVTTYPSAILLRAGLSSEDLITLNEEIAGMAQAGLPLDQGLAALAREMNRGRLQRVTAAIAADLQAGHTLPEAFARQTGRVPSYYAALVTGGIRSGRIAEVLGTLTSHARTMAELRSAMVGALLYPLLVFVLGLSMVTTIACFLMPHFEKVFQDHRMVLPLLTQWAFVLTRHPVLYFMLPPALLALFLVTVRILTSFSPAGQRYWARWVYAIPLAGTLIRASRLASFTDLLSILAEHQVPLPEAFRMAGAASSDPIMAASSQLIEEDLRRGLPLVDALRGRRALPEVITWIAGMGERRGKLAESLRQVSALYRRQAELRASLLRSVLPPLVILITAFVVVGLFVVSIFLPLLSLLNGLGL
jgi:general secretion pathway protein F